MKIPNSLRIQGVEYEVEHRDTLDDGCRVLFGQIDFCQSKILLHRGYSHEVQCLTLLHEALHGIECAAELELGEQRERIIEAFARGIYQILQDNGQRLFDIPVRERGG